MGLGYVLSNSLNERLAGNGQTSETLNLSAYETSSQDGPSRGGSMNIQKTEGKIRP